jgi:amino acid adenylation domain-containing protein
VTIEGQSDNKLSDMMRTAMQPFDLSKAPLLKVTVFRLGEQDHVIQINIHHIIADGMSMDLLFRELEALYGGNVLPALKLQYRDFSQWHNDLIASGAFDEEEQYWLTEFTDEMPLLDLPIDFPRPSFQSFEGRQIYFAMNGEDTERLKSLADAANVTHNMLFLSLFAVLLHRYSGQEDLVIGLPAVGRRHVDLESMVGMFVNTLAFRSHLPSDSSFRSFLSATRNKALEVYENQDYPFEMLVDKVSTGQDASRNPLVDIMFAWEDVFQGSILSLEGCSEVTIMRPVSEVAQFDLTLSGNEVDGWFDFCLEYCTKLFAKDTIERMCQNFQALIHSVMKDSSVLVEYFDILSCGEHHRILHDFNDTYADYPREKTLHRIFEEQVERTPGAVALVSEDDSLTYHEVNKRVNQLAHLLQSCGVGPDKIVGLIVERSFDMVISILGILKAGGAYLPIDPSYPSSRTEFMLSESNAVVLVSHRKLDESINFGGLRIHLDEESTFDSDAIENPDELFCSSRNLAYVIYTSGTTGRPKGVAVEHRSVVNHITWYQREYPLFVADHTLLTTSYTFDASVLELFWWFFAGCSLALLEAGREGDPEQLLQSIELHGISTCNLIPSMLEAFLQFVENRGSELPTHDILRYVIVGGETLSISTAMKFRKMFGGRCNLVNTYGPTEATIDITHWRVPEVFDFKNVPIGVPISNTRVYIVNHRLALQPVGVPGELCVSGDSLARGYLNRPELTAKAFVENPFTPMSLMYRTGDLVRWLQDGNIKFLGRIDRQVKIRGFRIELGEIEHWLLEEEGMKACVVVDGAGSSGDRYLCAYLVRQDGNLDLSRMQAKLRKNLPSYMVPSYFVLLDEIPLTRHGKVDQKALPPPEQAMALMGEYAAPTTAAEMKLVDIWKDVLGLENIGVESDFFHLGGHSLKAIQVMSRVECVFGISLTFKDVFQATTIRQQAQLICSATMFVREPIDKVEDREYYLASSAQKRLFILNELDRQSLHYNIEHSLQIKGRLNTGRLFGCLQSLVDRHESLRTSFHVIDGEVCQHVEGSVELSVSVVTIEGQSDNKLSDMMRTAMQPFDLSEAPLLKVTLFRLGEQDHVIQINIHHIIADGMSVDVLFRELEALYGGNVLPAFKLQYRDFSQWHNDLIASGAFDEEEQYWLTEFTDEVPLFDLPIDFPRPSFQSFEGRQVYFAMNGEDTERLKSLADAANVTHNMLFLSLFAVLLHRYSGQEDLVIGLPAVGRRHVNLESMVGMFVNTLAFRSHLPSESSFRLFLAETRIKALAVYENQDYPFEMLVDKVSTGRDASRNPLVDVMFAWEDVFQGSKLSLEGCSEVTIMRPVSEVAQFDLTLSGNEVDGRFEFCWEYCSKLFAKNTIEQMSQNFQVLIHSVMEVPNVPVEDLDILSSCERHRILHDFNDTDADYPWDNTLHQVFEEQVVRTPEAVALINKVDSMTYKEVNERANQLAHVLRFKGVGPDKIVGLIVERSFDMVISILGILKAGGAYLPIDPSYPSSRTEFMLSESNAVVLVSHRKLDESINFGGFRIDVDDEITWESDAIENPEELCTSGNLAYVIYTSGTTGKPKGVGIEHRSVVNNITWYQREYPLFVADHTLLTTSYTFDASVLELFWWFFAGCSLALLEAGREGDPEQLLQSIELHGISTCNLIPSMLEAFLQFVENRGSELPTHDILRYVIVGGETLSISTAMKFRKMFGGRCNLVNTYGPTEATIDITHWRVPEVFDFKNVPIGVPISNTRVYIVNHRLALQPVGVPGELCVSGDSLARGYLNRPELTAKAFVENPFTPMSLMYRTGDLVRWLQDGNIKFLGRIDRQVKIRGFRIELGEIEHWLLEEEGMKACVVVDGAGSSGDRYLCAYLVRQDGNLDLSRMQAKLRKNLPSYMVPSYFVLLDEIPLTRHGKVDQKALPPPEQAMALMGEYAAPTTAAEMKLVDIWKDVLGLENIGVESDFFHLGGHSLKAIQVMSRVECVFGISLTFKDVFQATTIRQQAQLICSATMFVREPIDKVEDREYYLASSAQKRLFILNELDRQSLHYNIEHSLQIKGRLNTGRLFGCLQSLVDRHESLRTSFHVIDGEVCQHVEGSVELSVSVVTIEGQSDNKLSDMMRTAMQPFDLSEAPLLKVTLFRLGEQVHVIQINIHHIIADGMSMDVLFRELEALYGGKVLPALRLQYRDFSQWQNDLIASGAFDEQEQYWLTEFTDEVPLFDLAIDFPRPSFQSFEGRQIYFAMNGEDTERLKSLADAANVTHNMLFLSLFAVLLHRYSGQEDLVIGLPAVGRRNVNLESMVGMFVNTLAFRSHLPSESSFRLFLAETRKKALAVYENQDYPFEMLVDKVSTGRDASRNPLVDVTFAWEDVFQGSILSLEGCSEVTIMRPVSEVAQFDLTLSGNEVDGRFGFCWEYCSKLFAKDTIERMCQNFQALIHSVMKDSTVLVECLDILSCGEHHRILHDFNDTYADYPREKTLHRIFEEQVERTPGAVALVYEDDSLTYHEVNERVNQLAHLLRSCGVGPDKIVGLIVERSFDMVISILGILKAGGAYLPIDPSYPSSRTEFMLSESNAVVLVSHRKLDESINFGGLRIDLDDESTFDSDAIENPDALFCSSRNLAYVIYTSGTTGRPKGVAVEHHSVVNHITWCQREYPLFVADHTLLTTSYTFDPSVLQLFSWYFAGCSLALLEPGAEGDPEQLMQSIELHGISTCNLVPSILNTILLLIEKHGCNVPKQLDTLRWIVVGGETLTVSAASSFRREFGSKCDLVNEYGPTEATICVTHWQVPEVFDFENIPIGVPISNTRAYIVNDRLTLQPIGVPGELCVSGDCLARGYLNRPDLTAKAFVENPFSPGKRMYHTGDLARWLPDGNIELLGHMDRQVKIRGFRIELGEIEHWLLEEEGVMSCVVVAGADSSGDRYLCAYLVLQDGNLDLSRLQSKLRKNLPSYMVPSYFVLLDDIPLTRHGKVDRKALPPPEQAMALMEEYAAPTMAVEKKLVDIWKDVLGLEKVGVESDFFHIGGTSMSAIRVVSKIRETLCPDFSVRDFFIDRTIKQLAQRIANLSPSMQLQQVAGRGSFILDELVDEGTGFVERKPASWIRASLQTIGAFIISGVASLAVLPALLLLTLTFQRFGVVPTVLVAPLCPILIMAGSAVLVNILKWLLIGCYHPGVHSIWSWYFIRWWFVGRLISYMNLALGSWIRGTVFMRLWQCMLGSRVGLGTVLCTTFISEPDLVKIGKNVTVDENARICGHTFHKGHLILGPVEIGDCSYIGHKSVVLPYSTVQQKVTVGPQTLVAAGMRCEEGSYWVGSPAARQEATPVYPPRHPFVMAWIQKPAVLILLQLLGLVSLSAAVVIALAPMILLAGPLQRSLHPLLGQVVLLTIGPLAGLLIFSSMAVLAKWVLIGCSRQGCYVPSLVLAFRQWLVDRFLTSTLVDAFTSVLWSSVLCNWFYRLVGVTIGRHTVVSPLVLRHDADMLRIGEGVWIGSSVEMFPTTLDLNQSFACGGTPHASTLLAKPVVVGDQAMVAEQCLMLSGSSMGPQTSLGSWSVLAQNQQLPESSVWIGSPSIMIQSQVAGTCLEAQVRNVSILQSLTGWDTAMSEARTYYLMGRAFEVCLIIFFLLLQAAALTPCVMLFDLITPHLGPAFSFSLIPLMYLLYGFISFFISVVVKMVAMPYFRGNHPYWSILFMAWHFINALVGFGLSIIYPNVRGSALGVVAIRLFGARVGKDVFFDTVPSCEMDLVVIGDSVILQEETAVMAHVVDNGRLQYGPVKVEDACTLNLCSTLLPGSVMKTGSTLGPLSVVMKGETIPPHSCWVGNPAYPMNSMSPNENRGSDWIL